jgi:hypothetical protein
MNTKPPDAQPRPQSPALLPLPETTPCASHPTLSSAPLREFRGASSGSVPCQPRKSLPQKGQKRPQKDQKRPPKCQQPPQKPSKNPPKRSRNPPLFSAFAPHITNIQHTLCNKPLLIVVGGGSAPATVPTATPMCRKRPTPQVPQLPRPPTEVLLLQTRNPAILSAR